MITLDVLLIQKGSKLSRSTFTTTSFLTLIGSVLIAGGDVYSGRDSVYNGWFHFIINKVTGGGDNSSFFDPIHVLVNRSVIVGCISILPAMLSLVGRLRVIIELVATGCKQIISEFIQFYKLVNIVDPTFFRTERLLLLHFYYHAFNDCAWHYV